MFHETESPCRTIWLPLVFCLVSSLGVCAWSQDAPAPKPAADPFADLAPSAATAVAAVDPAAGGTNLVLAVSAKPSENKDDLEHFLATGLQKTEGVASGKPIADEISRDFYETVATVAIKGFQGRKTAATDVILEPYLKTSEYWTVHLKNPEHDLQSLTLIMDDGSKKEFKPGDTDGRLKFRSLGGYSLKLDPEWKIKSYQATVFVNDQDKTGTALAEEVWPQSRLRYWLVEVPDFVGGDAGRQRLFGTLTNSKKMPNPLVSVSNARSTTIVVASFVSDVPRPGLRFVGNRVTFWFPPLPDRHPKRVVMMFPLTDKDWESTLETYAKLGVGEKAGAELSKMIHANWVPQDSPSVLNTSSPARWYDIPAVPKTQPTDPDRGFEREFVLEDIPGWKAAALQNVWRLYAYEFEDATESGLIRIDHNGKPVYVADEKVDQWPIEVKTLQ
ncbi:MAG: hypothetical protein NTY19_26010 [Planctomycetota bacterium]|nr:hypothetical protein [Planctomycetota bacterium]